MATPPSDDTITLFKLLADEQWHPYFEIRDKLAKSVPPGRALRKYDEAYRMGRTQRKQEPTGSPLSEDDQILYGARKCAQVTISSWKGKGIISRGEGADKEVRIKPGFQAWGVSSAPETPQKPEGSTEVPPQSSVASESRPDRLDEESPPSPAQPEPAVRENVPEVSTVQPEPVEDVIAVPDPVSPAGPPPSDYAWPPMSPAVIATAGSGCTICGLQVGDLMTHGQWHEELDSSLREVRQGLEDQLRSASQIEEVFARVLDQFQGGMQGYLDQQFAQVNSQLFALRADHPPAKPWTVSKSPLG